MIRLSICLLILVSILSCTPEYNVNGLTKQECRDVDSKEFNVMRISYGGILLDIRTPEEYANGAIDNAMNINYLDAGFSKQIQSLEPNRAIFLYGQTGERSEKVKNLLCQEGFSQVYHLIGGYENWPHK
ncbi:MAG: hypothetical protein GQ574_08650 [Crocinitomix sp.]|nr:hypothetical protein [Crocinitomix sp.]